MKKFSGLLMSLCAVLTLAGCATIPEKASAVKDFDLERYLGRWYEIARMDFRFERNMNNTTADYSLNSDGTVKVVNSGYNYVKNEFSSAVGKAKFRGSSDIAELKVSFFGPFYASYNVIALDPGYKYALVAGKNTDYLWILSRTPDIPDDVRDRYLEIAIQAGYDVSKLVWVEHKDI